MKRVRKTEGRQQILAELRLAPQGALLEALTEAGVRLHNGSEAGNVAV